jgi:hypothetical protein
MEHFMELLHACTDSANISENNCTTKNSNVPYKIEVSTFGLETVKANEK